MDNEEKYVKMIECIMRSCFPEYEHYTLEQQEKAHEIIQGEIIKLGTQELFDRCYFMEYGAKDLTGGSSRAWSTTTSRRRRRRNDIDCYLRSLRETYHENILLSF